MNLSVPHFPPALFSPPVLSLAALPKPLCLPSNAGLTFGLPGPGIRALRPAQVCALAYLLTEWCKHALWCLCDTQRLAQVVLA